MNESHIYNTIGRNGIDKMCTEFYKIMRDDDLVGKMYPDHDWDGAEERLRDFLHFRLGGDQTYTTKRGHPRLRMRHMPFLIGEKEADRWVSIMDQAMKQAEIPEDASRELHNFFKGVADFMRNH